MNWISVPFLFRLLHWLGSAAPSELQRYKVTKKGLRASGLRVLQPEKKIFNFQGTYLIYSLHDITSTPNLHQFCIMYQMLHWPHDGFRQAEILRILIYVNLILASLRGSQAILRPFGGSVPEKFFIYTLPRNLNIYPISSLLIKMYYFVSTFIDSSGA